MAGGSRSGADATLISTLAGGSTVEAAAKLCGVSERTIYRRLKDQAFRRRLHQARADMLERALGVLAQGATDAAAVLRLLLQSEDPRVKLRAAREVLVLAAKLRETADLEERLQVLEKQLPLRKRPR